MTIVPPSNVHWVHKQQRSEVDGAIGYITWRSLSLYSLNLDGALIALTKTATKMLITQQLNGNIWEESEMSDKTNPDRTESREVLRELLSRMQDETSRRIEDLRQDQTQLSDEIDSTRTTGDIETNAGLIALAEEKRKHLDEAMVRLDAGEYGSCLKCAGAISFERLMAVPFASYCVDCQEKLNRKEGGWGHSPYDRQRTASKEVGSSPQPESYLIAREEPSHQSWKQTCWTGSSQR
jgi:DnaK suppressor protein